ncbi:MAG: TylF/MycF/NovP-related O-methyltransferase [bacterium]|jgi:hypothetical protein
MKNTIIDITNKNTKNNPKDEIYKSFNDFIFSEDTKLVGKLLHRFQHFLNIKDIPGDIVEVGVFKGSGIATFSKFIEVYCPNSNKKVLGFDIFGTVEADEILNKDSKLDKESMNIVYNRVNVDDLSLESVKGRLLGTKISTDKYELIKGDVETSIPRFLEENPGFRISMLYIDVDLDRPTYFALKYLWDRILPGGVILFDEFEYHKFTESKGVEKFLKEKGIDFSLKSTNWIAPTAYMYKKGF